MATSGVNFILRALLEALEGRHKNCEVKTAEFLRTSSVAPLWGHAAFPPHRLFSEAWWLQEKQLESRPLGIPGCWKISASKAVLVQQHGRRKQGFGKDTAQKKDKVDGGEGRGRVPLVFGGEAVLLS